MGDLNREVRVSESANPDESDNTVFDASRYEFFGNDVVEEVELGGLEDDDDEAGLVGLDDKDYQSYSFRDREEVDGFGSFSDIDDISSTFSKLDTTVNDPRETGITGVGRSFSRENSLTPAWPQDKQWSSQSDLASDFQQLYRNSSYPLRPLQQNESIMSEPLPVPRSSFTSYQPPGGLPVPFSPPNLPAFSPPTHFLPGHSPMRRFSGGSGTPPFGHPDNFRQPNPNHWPNQAGPLPGIHPSNALMHPRLHQVPQPSLPHQMYNPPMLGVPDNRMRPVMRGRPNPRFYQQDFNDPGWPLFRAKYMSSEEIDTILRIQHAATHSNDPYVDDYYHEACVAKKSLNSNMRLRRFFCPTIIRDPTTRSRVNSEPHAFLQVDALGRIPFSSIKRPRPLLEVDTPSDSGDTNSLKTSVKPLEQEPMLAARTVIEDSTSLLLDADDIERLVQFNPPQDGGAFLRQKRHGYLEVIASSLQLVDPLRHGITSEDDLMFIRVVSIPKGRKFLIRYLKALYPGDDLTRIVIMAVFRHLRILFGELPSDSAAAKTTHDLMLSVTSTVRAMSLSSLSACLAAIVCSSEQPPLRPMGSPSGDGASVIIIAVMETSASILRDPNTSTNCSPHNVDLWQESFNAFFKLLVKYCVNKFENACSRTPSSGTAGDLEVKRAAISREMPVELLRASLPHTNENQRKELLDLARRSMPVAGNGSGAA